MSTTVPQPASGLSPWAVPGAIGAGLGVGLFLETLVLVIGGATGTRAGHQTPAVALVSNAVVDASIAGAAILFGVRGGWRSPQAFGFRRTAARRAAVAMAGLGALYYALGFLYGRLVHVHSTDRLSSDFGIHRSHVALAAAAVFVCVIAPFAEEFFFRGFVLGALRGRLGFWPAAALTSLLFGGAHAAGSPAGYLPLLALFGLALCVLRERTGSLSPGIALHALNNVLALSVNDLHWRLPAILGLLLASWAVLAVIVGPLSGVRVGPAS